MENIVKIKFNGIDDFNRPIYKVIDKNVYLGSVKTLVPNKNKFPNGTKEEINNYFKNNINELVIFGTSFNCEPMGNKIKSTITLKII